MTNLTKAPGLHCDCLLWLVRVTFDSEVLGCISILVLVTSASCAGARMRTRTIISVFGLAVCLIGGCAPAGFRHPHWNETANAEPINPAGAFVSAPENAIRLNPALLALIREQDKQEENLFAPIALTASDSPLRTSEKKIERPEWVPQQTVQSDAPVTLQTSSGLHADDQLLDLLQKDLDRAVKKPTERRQLEFSKAVRENPKVRYYLDYFLKNGKNYFQRALAQSGKYMPLIGKVLREEGLPEELGYLALIESGFVIDSSSSSGAAGIWQFVPMTARRYGLKIDAWVDERRDLVKSTRAAAAYLKDLHNYYGRWYLATAAYNAGQGTIDRAMQASGAKGFWKLSETAKLREETRNFVPKFVAASLIAGNPGKYGFGSVRYEAPIEYEEIELNEAMTLRALAMLTETDPRTLQELNPQLLRDQTPPGDSAFRVKVPVGQATLLANALVQRKESEPVQVIAHKVEKGETLFSIARHYGQSVKSLMELNGLDTHKLNIGQQLKILIETVRGVIR
jgi:soluble lytic murein transglycosylase-like protein